MRKKLDPTSLGLKMKNQYHDTSDFFVLPYSNIKSIGESLPQNKIKFLAIIACIFFGVLTIRSFYLQASQKLFISQAEVNRLRMIVEYAPRGVFFDHNGKQLVQNVASNDLVAYPNQLSADLEKTIEILREMFPETTVDEFREKLTNVDRLSPKPIPLISNITHEKMLMVLARSSDLPGIGVENKANRKYADGGLYSHILGYVGKITAEEHDKNSDYLLTESIGKTGLEKTYEKILRGKHGARRVEVNSAGKVKDELSKIPAEAGVNLRLTIDSELQKKVTESLKNQLQKAGVNKGVAIAMDPRNGDVKALVSLPNYDDTALAQGSDHQIISDIFANPNQPLLNRVIQGQYPPGSTFKLAVSIGGLEERVIDANTIVQSTGGIRVGSWFFPDWKAGGHGTTNLFKALAESVNTFFYIVGGGHQDQKGLGIEKITKWAEKLGFGLKTGIDLPGEKVGFLPSPDWKLKNKKEPWYIGDTYHAAIGQGDILVTPIQMANVTATIANGGIIFEPRLVDASVKSDGSVIQEYKAKIKKQNVFDPGSGSLVRQGLRQTVTDGSGRALNDLSVAIAGKTGTAQTSGGKTHAWFTSFAPYDNPELVFTVMLEDAGGGDVFAVPVAKDVYDWYFTSRDSKQK